MKNCSMNRLQAFKTNKKRSLIKVMLLGFVGMLLTVNAQAQSAEISLSVEDATLESVINKLKKQCDFSFVYNNEEVRECESITFSVEDKTVEEVLSLCLEDCGLSYKKLESTIVITPRSNGAILEPNAGKNLTQTVRGTIIDADTKIPLIGATIRVVDSDPIVGMVTGVDGRFRLEKIPVGRTSLLITYIGYQSTEIPNLEVNSGKEVVLNLSLQESTQKMNEVVISGSGNRGEALNDMALISARSISTEETKRYAGGFSDPSRILASFAGVTNSHNGENDIIVRGNSPKYVQWRLEGLEMSNPTHFGDQNGIKGGISALNNNLLATSDFLSGAFSADYGDVLSGVFDVKLRPGNNEKFEAAIGVGLLGTDLTLEGPFKKGYGGSYLINYRYSTVGLINNLGIIDIEGNLSYQDATFKVVLPTKKAGTFSFFGLGGLSGFLLEDIDPDGQAIPDNGIVQPDFSKDFDKTNYLFNGGMNHVFPVSKNSYFKSSLSFSTTGNLEDVFETETVALFDDQGEPTGDSVANEHQDYKNRLQESTYRGAITYHNKLNARNKIQIGTKYSLFDYDYEQSQTQDESLDLIDVINFRENVGTVRNFISWKHRFNEEVTLVSGLHNMNVLYNQKSTLEPRVALNWQVNPTNSIRAGYGSHSNMESIHNYFAKVEQPDGSVTEPNGDLGLLKAHHFVLGYEKRFTENLVMTVEGYYQHLYNLPVENNDTSFYSTINEGTDFRYVDLVNEGTGKNYGVELTVERFLNNNYYYLINTSLYESKYKSLENVERNTQYNGNYLVNVLFGKEFVNLGKKENQTFALNVKGFYGGGRKIIPLLRDDQGNVSVDVENNRFWDYEKAYESKIDDVFQVNVSGSYKWNRPKATHEIFMDLINVTNNAGRVSEYYDGNEPNSIGYVKQLSFFPNLMYRVYF